MGTIVIFVQECARFGFEILKIQPDYPDAIIRKNGVEYRAEFEFDAKNFLAHQHDPRDCDIIICWKNNLKNFILPVIVLSDQNWHLVSLNLPSDKDREIAYWKYRARRAEGKLKRSMKEFDALTKKQPSKRPPKKPPEWLTITPQTRSHFRELVESGQLIIPGYVTGRDMADFIPAVGTERSGQNWLSDIRIETNGYK